MCLTNPLEEQGEEQYSVFIPSAWRGFLHDFLGSNLSEARLKRVGLWTADLEGVRGIFPVQFIMVHSLSKATMPDGSFPEEWALNIFGRGEITEEQFNKIVQLASVNVPSFEKLLTY